MRRLLLDPNVLVSAYISPKGASARLWLLLLDGSIEAVVSPQLLVELERVLMTSPRLTRFRDVDRITAFLTALSTLSATHPDASSPLRRCRDQSDDYLVALAEQSGATLVSGDPDLCDDGFAIKPRVAYEQLQTELPDLEDLP